MNYPEIRYEYKGLELPCEMEVANNNGFESRCNQMVIAYLPKAEFPFKTVSKNGNSGWGKYARPILTDRQREFENWARGKKIKEKNIEESVEFSVWFRSNDRYYFFIDKKATVHSVAKEGDHGWIEVNNKIPLDMNDIKPGDELMSPNGVIFHGFSYSCEEIRLNSAFKRWEDLQKEGYKIRSIGECWRLCEKEAGR